MINDNFPFVLLSCATGNADSRTPVIEHIDYDVCTIEYVCRGRGTVEYDGELYECGKDSVYFLHRNTTHRYWPDKNDPWHKVFWVLDGEMVDFLLRIYRLDSVKVIPDVPNLSRYFEAMTHLGFGGDMINQQAAVIFHQFVEECARGLYEPDPPSVPEVMELKKTLDRSIEQKFNLEEFSRRHNVSSAHLIRSFRRTFGCAPYEYLMRQRVDAAQRLLTYSSMSVKEIACSLGFSDQYYFSGCFKKRTGMSPSMFRMHSAGSKR